MRGNAMASWGPVLTALLLVGGGVLIWTAVDSGTPRPAAMVVGVTLVGLAVVLLAFTASARVRRDAIDRNLKRYGCSRCGYAPHPEELETGESFPCPTCGQPMYLR